MTAGYSVVSGIFALQIVGYIRQSGRYVAFNEQCNLLSIVDDSLDEDNEQIHDLHAGGPFLPSVYVLEQTQSNPLRLTIVVDDGEPALSIADAGGAEGQTLEFTVTLAPASGKEVTVDWAVNDGAATAPGDYTDGSDTLTFAKGETSKTISVATEDDDDVEGVETFTVTLSNAVNASISDDSATGTIPANDAPVLSSDASLDTIDATTNLGNPLPLSPGFNSATTEYAIAAPNTVTSVSLSAYATHSGATVQWLSASDTVLATTASYGANSLAVGVTVLKVKVTAQDGIATKTFTITIIRAAEEPTSPLIYSGWYIGEAFEVEVVFRKNHIYASPVTGFELDDITVTNGTATNLTDVYGGVVWRVTVTPTDSTQPVTVGVAARGRDRCRRRQSDRGRGDPDRAELRDRARRGHSNLPGRGRLPGRVRVQGGHNRPGVR